MWISGIETRYPHWHAVEHQPRFWLVPNCEYDIFFTFLQKNYFFIFLIITIHFKHVYLKIFEKYFFSYVRLQKWVTTPSPSRWWTFVNLKLWVTGMLLYNVYVYINKIWKFYTLYERFVWCDFSKEPIIIFVQGWWSPLFTLLIPLYVIVCFLFSFFFQYCFLFFVYFTRFHFFQSLSFIFLSLSFLFLVPRYLHREVVWCNSSL